MRPSAGVYGDPANRATDGRRIHSAAMINFTPEPIAIHLGPIPVYWYGIAYAIGLLVAYLVLVRQARQFRQDPELIGNALIIIAIAALIGGRAYHVIDQWHLYQDNPIKIFLPPYSGLGVYGGLITGVLAFLLLVRYHRINGWIWADIVAPALFTMQAIGRWGTSSTRSSSARRPTSPGASPSTVPTASAITGRRSTHARSSPRRQPSSRRSSCTNRSPASSARSSYLALPAATVPAPPR